MPYNRRMPKPAPSYWAWQWELFGEWWLRVLSVPLLLGLLAVLRYSERHFTRERQRKILDRVHPLAYRISERMKRPMPVRPGAR